MMYWLKVSSRTCKLDVSIILCSRETPSVQCAGIQSVRRTQQAKDQELLDTVVEERKLMLIPPRNTAIFHHLALGEFEIHLPVGVHEVELEERILQQLVAAAMGRARHFARGEGRRGRSSAQGRPELLVFSAHPGSQDDTVSYPNERQAETISASSVVVTSSPSIQAKEREFLPPN